VIAPYTRQRPEVVKALATRVVEFCDVSGSDDAYWTLLDRLWGEGETFCVVEHDVIARPDALDQLANCSSSWCAFEVPYVGITYAGLSCAKFSSELIARYPDALNAISELSDKEHPAKHWCRLDSWLQGYVLHPGGEHMCVHGPPLEHVRDEDGDSSPSHGCGQ
jgi:hypothetical protein